MNSGFPAIRDAIMAAENVIQALQNSKDNSDPISILNGPCYKFGVIFVNAFMEFYTKAYKEIPTNLLMNDEDIPEWLMNSSKKSRQESQKKAKGEKHTNPQLILRMPFHGHEVKEKNRYEHSLFLLEKFLDDDSKWKIIEDFIPEAIDVFSDPKLMKRMHKFRELFHTHDVQTSSRRVETIDPLLDFIDDTSKVKSVEKAARFVIFLSCYESLRNSASHEEPFEFEKTITSSFQMLDRSIGLSQTVNESNKIHGALLSKPWGPSHYTRDPNEIRRVKNMVENNPVTFFMGWGGVGKTALAEKLMLDYSDDELYKKYVYSTFKLHSKQGELIIHDQKNLGQKGEASQDDFKSSPRNLKNGSVQGSFQSVARSIIRCSKSKTHSMLETWLPQKLMEVAVDVLIHEKVFVCIDNFEDLSDTDEEVLERNSTLLNNEYNLFVDFFEKFTEASMDAGVPNVKSRVIVTARGTPPEFQYLQVQYLRVQENFDLFNAKLLDRVRDKQLPEQIMPYINQEISEEVKQAFEKWRKLEIQDVELGTSSGTHPMNTICAAVAITGKHDVIQMIEKFSPEQKEGISIAKYCTTRMLGHLDGVEKDIILEAAKHGSNKKFTHAMFRDFAKKTNNAVHFGAKEFRAFTLKFERALNWFVEVPNAQPAQYRWVNEIFVHLRQSDELPIETLVSKIPLEKIDFAQRNKMYSWMLDPKLTSTDLNKILGKMSHEEDLYRWSLITGRDLLFSAETLKSSVSSSPESSWDFKDIPKESLVKIMKNFFLSRREFKPGEFARKQRNWNEGYIATPQGKFYEASWPFVLEYITNLVENFGVPHKTGQNIEHRSMFNDERIYHLSEIDIKLHELHKVGMIDLPYYQKFRFTVLSFLLECAKSGDYENRELFDTTMQRLIAQGLKGMGLSSDCARSETSLIPEEQRVYLSSYFDAYDTLTPGLPGMHRIHPLIYWAAFDEYIHYDAGINEVNPVRSISDSDSTFFLDKKELDAAHTKRLLAYIFELEPLALDDAIDNGDRDVEFHIDKMILNIELLRKSVKDLERNLDEDNWANSRILSQNQPMDEALGEVRYLRPLWIGESETVQIDDCTFYKKILKIDDGYWLQPILDLEYNPIVVKT
jgi:hypothetical protein